MWVEMYHQRYVTPLQNNAFLAISITSEMKECALELLKNPSVMRHYEAKW